MGQILPAAPQDSQQWARGDNTYAKIPRVDVTQDGLCPQLTNTGTKFLRDDGNWVSGGGGGSSGSTQVWGEIPTGAINGINRVYTTVNTYTASLLAVYLNGLRLRHPDDYTETSNQSFQFINAPLSGDSIIIDYIQL